MQPSGPAWLACGMLLAGCAGGADRPEPARIVVEPAARDGHWRATFVLEQPADHLRFQRPASFYREQVWEVVTPGWRLGRNGDLQTLVAEPAAAARRVVVEFPVHTDSIPKEYELFLSFTDGSVALYTGHLYVTTSRADDPDETFLRRVELVPPPGDRLVVHGEVVEGRTVWDDPHGDGSYVYFGRIEPLVTDDLVAVLDPGAPAWLLARLQELLPRMLATYAERFGHELPWKPVVLFGFDDAATSGLSSGGGTLTGQVQMSAQGLGWREPTPQAAEQLLHLVAHEAAHFWNGQLVGYRDMADSWMHEGSADALASLALLRAGAIDDERLAARRTRALNDCALGLRDGSLSSSDRRRQFRNYYTCGELLAVWSVGVLPGPRDETRLFDVWRAVIAAAADRADGKYGRETYLDALAELGAEPEPLAALETFLDAVHADPATALEELMALAGLRLVSPDRPLPELRFERAAEALGHLMADACEGRYSFYREDRRLLTTPLEGCPPFERERVVVAIEGHAVGPAGDRAFQAVTERCRRGRPVTLGLEGGGTVEVPCRSAPPTPPRPLAFADPPAPAG